MSATHSSLPEPLAWPLWAVTATVTILRLRWCNTGFANRHINSVLGTATVAWLLLIGTFQEQVDDLVPWLTPARQYQLAHAIMIVTAAEAYQALAYARQRNPPTPSVIYAAAAALALGYLLAGNDIAAAGLTPFEYPGWQAAAVTSPQVVFSYAAAALIVTACVQELAARPPLGTRVLYLAMLLMFVGLLGGITFGLTASLVLATGHTNNFTAYAAEIDRNDFVLGAIGFTPIAAISLVLRIIDLCRGDPVARAIADLTPLWRELTRACPELVQPTPPTMDPTYQLHRMVIEINDAVQSLSPYVPTGKNSPGASLHTIAGLLQTACEAKRTGQQPNSAAQWLDLPGGADLQSETRILTSLAKEWSKYSS